MKSDHALVLQSGRTELNLVEAPWVALTDSKTRRQRPHIIDTPDWKITGCADLGLPGPKALETYWGLLSLAKRDDFRRRTVHFSAYGLMRHVLQWPYNGYYYHRLRESLDALAGVRILCRRWRNLKHQTWTRLNLGIVETFELFTQNAGGNGQTILPVDRVVFNADLFRSLKDGYIRELPWAEMHQLESPLTKRLWEYLLRHLWKKDFFPIGLDHLTHDHLGEDRGDTTWGRSNLWKRKLKPAFAELVTAGFIYPPHIDRTRDDWVVTFSAPNRPRQILPPRRRLHRATSPVEIFEDPKLAYGAWIHKQIDAALDNLSDDESEELETEVDAGVRAYPIEALRGNPSIGRTVRHQIIMNRLALPDFRRWKQQQ